MPDAEKPKKVVYVVRFRAFAKGARWKDVAVVDTHAEAVAKFKGSGNWRVVKREVTPGLFDACGDDVSGN